MAIRPGQLGWINCSDRDNTVLSFMRKHRGDHAIVVMNFTPVPREGYRVGVPGPGRYVERLSTDDLRFGGSEFETVSVVEADPVPWDGKQHSIKLQIPPLGALILMPS